MDICIFGGASPQTEQGFLDLGFETGQAIARAGHRLVFGGGANGMMGAAANGALSCGGSVTGILPRFLFDREPPHPGVTDMRVVETMHERKALMYVSVRFPRSDDVMECLLDVHHRKWTS